MAKLVGMEGTQWRDFKQRISPQKASVNGLRFVDGARATGGVSRVQAMLFDVIPAAVWHWFVDRIGA